MGSSVAKGYKIGFARPALIRESVIIAALYSEKRNWPDVKTLAHQANVFQTRTQKTHGIVFSEIQSRLRHLNIQQIDLIADDFEPDVKQLVWLALCKHYPFIHDFSLEVLYKAFETSAIKITHDDYGSFFNSKSDWHPELETITEKTKSNARQTLFLMMRQCGIITDDKELLPQILSEALRTCTDSADLIFLPGAV